MTDVLDFLIDVLAERYSIERELGAGGMATVYLAHDLKHERKVAVKVLRPELTALIGAKRFLNEIKVTANLQHPHILPLHDSGEAGGLLFYVMPYVEGESLRAKLAREGQLAVDEARGIANAVGMALDYAHRQGVVHRDIKPENILLHEGEAMVADFGIALVVSAAGESRLTAKGAPIGTPVYMSPEQVGGDQELDGRSDQYALACVLYEMLAGEPPFTGATVQAVMARHLTDPVPPLTTLRASVGASLEAAIEKALGKSPADRFATCAEFIGAVTDRAASLDTPAAGVDAEAASRSVSTPLQAQQIHFCTARDGTSIAYATVGEGAPLVKAANWLSHLEYDLQNPMWRHWLHGLATHNYLVRYDERGCGLSDWDVEDMSFEAWVNDLEAVVDASGLDRFALMGVSQGGPIAIAYAVRHPEKVSHVILHGSYARGKRLRGLSDRELAEGKLLLEMVKVGWGHKDNPAFRQVFTTLFYPDAAPEQLRWFNDLQRVSSSPENAARIIAGFDSLDVRDLAPKVAAPTLVLHSQGELRVPFNEGRLLASLIPGARFVPLDSRNHIPLENEPAWQQFLDTVYGFLGVGTQ